jgi:hypothetical protein
MALHLGIKPAFFNHHASQETFVPYPKLEPLLKLRDHTAMVCQHSTPTFLNGVDSQISDAWKSMSQFCSVINFAKDSRQYISLETYLDTMASIMYRLASMSFEPGSNSEMIRLSLLAFSCSVFLQWRPLGLSYAYLSTKYQAGLVRVASSHPPSEFLVWLLMVGAVSVLDPINDTWLKSMLAINIDCCNVESWDRMEALLDSFMWIGFVHNASAKKLYESTFVCIDRVSSAYSTMDPGWFD